MVGSFQDSKVGLALTVLLGCLFTGLQAFEYYETPFTISDSVYGSTFFLTTGAHGGHVLVGTAFLLVCFLRLGTHHFTRTQHHLGSFLRPRLGTGTLLMLFDCSFLFVCIGGVRRCIGL